MTTFQIKIALATKKHSSISNAAAELNVSQPNASNSLKLLEKEIGFEIFRRSRAGIVATEKGRYFLERAERMMKEHDEIMGIQDHEEVFRLRLGTPYYLDAIRPFLKLCEIHRDDTETDLRYRDISLNEGIEELAKFNLDVVFIAILKSQIVGVRNGCKQNNLTMIPIGELPAVINMRKDHPAALDGRAEKISQGCDLMKEYPYIVDRILNEDNTSTSYNDSDFIQSSYKIMSNEVDITRRLAACTNGFFFGLKPSKGINEQYGTVSFPVPGIMMEMSCLVRSDDVDRMEIKEYIQLLKEELNINDKKD